MASILGGDEVSAIVMDIGHDTVKAGFAGEDSPKAVFPSLVGSISNATNQMDTSETDGNKSSNSTKQYYVGYKNIQFRRDYMEIESPFQDGILNNFDVVEALLDHTYNQRLNVRSTEQPLLMGEVSYNTKESREKLTQLVFEKFQVPAFFVVKNPVLTCFAFGRSNALVVDSGAYGTCITPVLDGITLNKGITRNTFGGNQISEDILKHLQSKNVNIKPNYMFERKKIAQGKYQINYFDYPNTTESYKNYALRCVADDVKESVFKILDFPMERQAQTTLETYILNNDETIEVGDERFGIPDKLFYPSTMLERHLAQQQQQIPQQNSLLITNPDSNLLDNVKAVHLLAYESIQRCDAETRKELYNNVILTGGNTLFPGFAKRFENELGFKLNIKIKPPQHSTNLPVESKNIAWESKCSAWIGGSILASLGTFQQMWISKQEFDEHGANIIMRKCA